MRYFGAALVFVLGCGLLATCGGKDSELARRIRASELHPLGIGCEGSYYELADGKLLGFVDGKQLENFSPPATLSEVNGSAVIDFGTKPLFYRWILTPTPSPDIFRVASQLTTPLSENQQAYYRKANRKSPEEINAIWNSFEAFTLCPRK
ncbi:hypothetical protein [Rhizobium sp. Root1203]|uniref:hypothetical protein n=1 Tax=Rhizobium sp. Root1203 TaxID=1736427 RepID=UPI0012E33B81|nr:hypothetical protein [Rhizobium sp. Root1203]